MIRGKRVGEARSILDFTVKRCALPLRKLLDSAVANAEHAARETRKRINTDDYIIREIQVGRGRHLWRYSEQSRGRALPIRKHSSNVKLEITEK
jgi:large subunit ribosomal protein L22